MPGRRSSGMPGICFFSSTFEVQRTDAGVSGQVGHRAPAAQTRNRLTNSGDANSGGDGASGGDANPNDAGASHSAGGDASASDACANPSGGHGASRGDARARGPNAPLRA